MLAKEVAVAVDHERLKCCALFREFTDTGLGIFAALVNERTVAAGLSVVRAGAASEGLVIVESGRLSVHYERAGVSESAGELGPGAYFGELGLVRSGARVFTVRAQESARLLELKRADFQGILSVKPQACLKLTLALLAGLDERMRRSHGALLG